MRFRVTATVLAALLWLSPFLFPQGAGAQTRVADAVPGSAEPLVGVGAPPAETTTAPSLLAREPLGYDLETVPRLRDLVVATFRDAPGILRRVRARGEETGLVGSLLLLSLMLAVVITLAGYRHLPGRFDRALAPSAASLPPAAGEWLRAAGQVSAATAPPLVLWLLHQLLTQITGFAGPGFAIVGIFLRAWASYALVTSTLFELVRRPLIPVPAEHGRYLYGIARGLAVYGLVLYSLLDAASVLGVPGDVIALVEAMLDVSLVLLLSAFLARKAAVMALFPKLPNRVYQSFVRGFGAAYPVILVLTSGTLLLAVAGYDRLARAVWMRSWAVVAVFLTVVFVLHLAHQILHRLIVSVAPTKESSRFYSSSARLLDMIGALVFVVVALRLTGLRDPVVDLLALPALSVADRRLSLLMIGEAFFMVGVFVVVARLLRDYLNYQVYPALGVDSGVSTAIDVVITYAMLIVGILFALEFIGVGVGVLTVFAGALGIGLGFGLQPIANNLTSGLTLVFGRALRRGDWVTHGDTVGVIEEIGMRATSLRTRDAVEHLVPNSEFVSGTIVNWTHSSPLVREHVPVGVAYGSDPDFVRAILLRVAATTPGVESEPPPEVWFTGFGNNSLDFDLLVWMNMKALPKASLRSELYFAIFRAFKESGVEIPFPQQDLHLRSVSPQSVQALAEMANGNAPEEPAVGRAARR